MSKPRHALVRLAALGLLVGASALGGAPAARAGGWQHGAGGAGWGGGGRGAWGGAAWGGGAWGRGWRAGSWGWGGGHPQSWGGGWQHGAGGGWHTANRAGGPFSPFPHAPAGNGFGARNPYPGVQSFSVNRTTKLPGGRSVTYHRTFTRTGYGDYSYDRSVTAPGGRTHSVDATQTYNRATGSYARTVTSTGFNGKTSTSTSSFTRSSPGNYAYSYTDVGPNGKAYTRTIDQTYNPGNHDLTRSGTTTLRDGKTTSYTTSLNNAGNGIYDYSTHWQGPNGGSGSVSGTYSH